ncbi:MAG: TolC family protein [Acidobacteria bacterium]|nr:TolC family protein [Acidobacteriota bacterium]
MKIILIIMMMAGLAILPARTKSQERVSVPAVPLPVTTEISTGIGGVESKLEKWPVLTLTQALQIVLSKNRELAAARNDIQALKGARLQAGLLPDPELSVEMENVGGTGPYTGTALAETTIAFEQLIELGGKRKKRFRIADAELKLARYRYQSVERKVIADATAGFFDVLAAQKRFAIAEELFRISTSFHNTVKERVNAGKVSPVEETRASVVLSTAQIRLEKARRKLSVSRNRLAAIMGGNRLQFGSVAGELGRTLSVPDRNWLLQGLNGSPGMVKWETLLEQSRSKFLLAKAGQVPDLALSAGFRKFRETDDTAYVVGVTLRLPVWNRNRGRIMEARSRVVQAEDRMVFSTVNLRFKFQLLYEQLLTAVKEVTAVQTSMLPAARSAFEAVRMGYREGKFSFIEVLDAQRTYFNVEMEYVDALARYHRLKAGVEAMTGRKLGEWGSHNTKNAGSGETGGGK